MSSHVSQHLKKQLSILFVMIGVCLNLLAAVLLFSGIMFLVEPPPEGEPRETLLGVVFLAFTIVLVISGSLVIRFGRRYRKIGSIPKEITHQHLDRWHKTKQGPAWTDWLVMALPVVFVLPLVFLVQRPITLQTVLVLGGSILFLEMIFVPTIIWTRRKPFSLALVPEGLLLTLRSGKTHLLPAGSVSGVTLDLAAVSRYGSITAHALEIRHNGRTYLFVEPMSAPIPEIASAAARHLNREVQYSQRWLDRMSSNAA